MNIDWNEVGERRITTWIDQNIVTVEDLVLLDDLMTEYPENQEIELGNFLFHRRYDEFFVRGRKTNIQMGGEYWISRFKFHLSKVRVDELI